MELETSGDRLSTLMRKLLAEEVDLNRRLEDVRSQITMVRNVIDLAGSAENVCTVPSRSHSQPDSNFMPDISLNAALRRIFEENNNAPMEAGEIYRKLMARGFQHSSNNFRRTLSIMLYRLARREFLHSEKQGKNALYCLKTPGVGDLIQS